MSHRKIIWFFLNLTLLNLGLLLTSRHINADATAVFRMRHANESMPVGSNATRISGHDVNGSRELIPFPDSMQSRQTLLLVFTSTCKISNDLWPEWQASVARLSPQRFRIVAIDPTSSSTFDYIKALHPLIPIITAPDPATVIGNRLGATPQMILISPVGRVADTWNGVDAIRAGIRKLQGATF